VTDDDPRQLSLWTALPRQAAHARESCPVCGASPGQCRPFGLGPSVSHARAPLDAAELPASFVATTEAQSIALQQATRAASEMFALIESQNLPEGRAELRPTQPQNLPEGRAELRAPEPRILKPAPVKSKGKGGRK
jgi:hypothetical protein